jgi:hypothetical protein
MRRIEDRSVMLLCLLPLLLSVLIVATAQAEGLDTRPLPAPAVDPTLAASFAGSWDLQSPGGTIWVTCEKPVRLVEADTNYFFYLGVDDVEGDAATELVAAEGGARWLPIAGGPSFFALFVSADAFYLYDEVPQSDQAWRDPTYLYRRCPSPAGSERAPQARPARRGP